MSSPRQDSTDSRKKRLQDETDPRKKKSKEPTHPDDPKDDTTGFGATVTQIPFHSIKSDKESKASKKQAKAQVKDTAAKNMKDAEKKATKDKFDSLIKKLSSEPYSRDGERFPFTYDDLLQVLIHIKGTLLQDKSLLKCNSPCVIVGDIHGQYTDLFRIFNYYKIGDGKTAKPGWLNQRFVFLGDYIDRGKQSLEVIVFVFLLKIRFPQQIFLLRGNHECKAINRVYGFEKELKDRMTEKEAHGMFHMFNEAFTHLPYACIVGKHILCMHGGISPKLKSLQDIMEIPKPLVDPNTNELACDLLWADPMYGLKGYKPNSVRGTSVHFGLNVLAEVMKNLNLNLIVRGHQMMMNGFNFFGPATGPAKLVTIFTAPSYYPERPNRGAAMYVEANGKIGFKILIPSAEQKSLSERARTQSFFGLHSLSNDFDKGYVDCMEDEKKVGQGAVIPNEKS